MPENKALKIELQYVPKEQVQRVWGLLSPFFARAVEVEPGDYTVDQLRMLAASGAHTIIVAVRAGTKDVLGAMAIEFLDRPNARIAFVVATAGKGIINAETYAQLADMMRSCGATRIQCAAQEAMARLYRRHGMVKRYTIIESII